MIMRTPLICLAALLAVACATAAGGPSLRYADAASRGALASAIVGRPSADEVERATGEWSHALSDSFACGVPMRHVIDAGLVGALEIGAMNAAASRGGEREVRDAVSRYVATLVSLAMERRERPAAGRCDALADWAPRVAEQGRGAVERARRRGLLDEDSELVFRLLSR